MSSDSQSQRYARQIQFAPIGADGHDQITASRVAVLGCGALGTVAAEILARAGVGHLRLIDRDVVEWTNLQRQSLYIEQDAIEGRSKADAACERLASINSSIEIEPMVADVTSSNIRGILGRRRFGHRRSRQFLDSLSAERLGDLDFYALGSWRLCWRRRSSATLSLARDHHVFAVWSQSRHRLRRSIPVIPPASSVLRRT